MNKQTLAATLVLALVLASSPSHRFASTEHKRLSSAELRKIAILRADLRKLHTKRALTTTLQWKYGWEDGNYANTIGSAWGHCRFPTGSQFISTGYAPADLSAAYGFNLIDTNGDGSGQTIAVVDAYGSANLQSDLDAFNAQYGLPSNTVTTLYSAGKPTNADSGWAGETTLDVEWAHAMAPGASIVVVVAPDDSIASMINAVIYASTNANIVSMSWSTPEFAGQTQYDAAFSIPGVTFVAASGDTGAGVNWPASSTNVLGVGGTTLTYDTNSGVVSEVGWSGSGGGVSSFEPLPAYQAGWNANAGRGVPDISYDADPYTGVSVFFTDPTTTNAGAWYVFGGTSIGTPQWAALVARRASLGNQGTNSFNTVLYANADSSYATIINDITYGWNGYFAQPGYDFVTGLGTPVANQIAVLPAPLPTPTPTPSPTPTPTPIVWHGPVPIFSPFPLPSPLPTPPPGSGGWGGGWFNQINNLLNQLENWFNNWFGSGSGGGSPSPTPTPVPTPTATPTPSPTATPTPSPTATPGVFHYGHSGRY